MSRTGAASFFVVAYLVGGCILHGDIPVYQAYMVNGYPEELLATVDAYGAGYVYRLGSDPTVAWDLGREDVPYDLEQGWIPGRITLVRTDCSVLTVVEVGPGSGDWTVNIEDDGSTGVTRGRPDMKIIPVHTSQTPCPTPTPLPTSIP